MKEYIGDGVYADHDGYNVILTTEDGYSITNTIYLEPTVWEALAKYVRKYEEKDKQEHDDRLHGLTTEDMKNHARDA